jgi:hypothetical protein
MSVLLSELTYRSNELTEDVEVASWPTFPSRTRRTTRR